MLGEAMARIGPFSRFALAGVALLAAPATASAAEHRPRVGDLLVASRNLQDPNFDRTVILLLRYGESGAAGVIVNRPLAIQPRDLLPDIEGFARYSEPVFGGGPVATDTFAVLVAGDAPEEGTRRILDGVHLGASRETLERLLSRKKSRKSLRLYMGHAGWAPGQLDWEIDRGSWHVRPADRSAVFSQDPAGLWNRLVPGTGEDWVEERPASGAGTPGAIDSRADAGSRAAYQRFSPR